MEGASVLLLQQEIPEKVNMAAALVAKAKGLTVLQDAGGEDRPCSLELMKLIDFFCPNEQELQRLTGRPTTTREDVLTAARWLLMQGPRAVLVTLGHRGALLVSEEEVVEVPALPAKVVDATAASDAFRAAFAVALAEGQAANV